MDAFHAATYAEMLREIGIDVLASELCDDVQQPFGHGLDEPRACSPCRHAEREHDDEPHREPVAQYDHIHSQTYPDKIHVPYKRSSHFLSHLNQLTGRNGVTALPHGLMRRIKRSLGRKGVHDRNAYFRVRRLFKRWGYSSPEYRHIFAVLRHLGGPVLSLTYAQEVALRQDFDRLCCLFEHSHPLGLTRKAMISYYLVIQLLLGKYKIRSYYSLPSVKDQLKFQALLQAYTQMAGCRSCEAA